MPNWKKVILSGSNAHVNNISASGHFSALGGDATIDTNTGGEGILNLTNESGTDINSNDKLGVINFIGTGSNTLEGPSAIIQTVARQDFDNFRKGSSLEFYTANNGDSSTPTTLGDAKMVISESGVVFNTNIIATNITASGNISASGNIIINHITASGNISASGGSSTITATTGKFDNLHTGVEINKQPDGINANGILKIKASSLSYNSQIQFKQATIQQWSIGVPTKATYNSDFVIQHGYTNSNLSQASNFIIKSGSENVGIGFKAGDDVGEKLTVLGNISSSGNLFANTTDAGGSSYNTLMVDTATGQFYHTGSYGESHDEVTLVDQGLNYVILNDQQLTLSQIDLTTDVTGELPDGNLSANTAHLSEAQTFTGAKIFDNAAGVGLPKIFSNTYPNTSLSFGSNTISLNTNNTSRLNIKNTEVVVNDSSNDTDFRVEGNTETHLLFADASTDKVGIGTTPNHILDVYGIDSGKAIQKIQNRSSNTNADGLYVHLKSPQGTLYNGEGNATDSSNQNFIRFFDNNVAIGAIINNRTGVYYGTTSDRRLKKDIKPLDKSLNTLLKIKPREYKWKKGNNTIDHGFIAQELNDVYSQATIPPRNDEEYWQVEYSKLVPLLVKSVQEQQQMIEELKIEILKLKNNG